MPRLSRLIILLTLVLLISCTEQKPFSSSDIKISVTIAPYADFVQRIVGNRAKVNTLIPPGMNAHSFEPDPISIKNVMDSDIYFKVGKILQIENQLIDKLGESKFNQIVDCSIGIEKLNNDPHIWLSPPNVKIISQIILEQLKEKYPIHKNYFQNNWNKFITQIDSLDTLMKTTISSKKNKVIFVYHPAWTYFTHYYKLKQLSIEVDGKTPKANTIKEAIDEARRQNIKCIFFDPHFDDSSALTIAKSTGLEIDSLDPLPTDYIKNVIDINYKLNKYLW